MASNERFSLILPASDGTSFDVGTPNVLPLVLFFYPKDNTPGCTSEATDFRDRYPLFQQIGCQVVGISRDSLKSHAGFATKHGLPFPLLSDADEKACQMFDVIKPKLLYGKTVRGIERSTFLFDMAGNLVREWRKVKVPGHVDEVLSAVRALP